MISVNDYAKLRAVLERAEKSLAEKSAVDNVLHSLDRLMSYAREPGKKGVPAALARFNAMTGLEMVDDLFEAFATVSSSQRNPALEALDLDELVSVRRAWLAAPRGSKPPWQWSEQEIVQALTEL